MSPSASEVTVRQHTHMQAHGVATSIYDSLSISISFRSRTATLSTRLIGMPPSVARRVLASRRSHPALIFVLSIAFGMIQQQQQRQRLRVQSASWSLFPDFEIVYACLESYEPSYHVPARPARSYNSRQALDSWQRTLLIAFHNEIRCVFAHRASRRGILRDHLFVELEHLLGHLRCPHDAFRHLTVAHIHARIHTRVKTHTCHTRSSTYKQQHAPVVCSLLGVF